MKRSVAVLVLQVDLSLVPDQEPSYLEVPLGGRVVQGRGVVLHMSFIGVTYLK